MRILFTANCMWNLSHFRLSLIKSFIADGHKIYALAPYDGYEGLLRNLGVHVYNIEMEPHSTNVIHDYFFLKALRSKFKEINPDFVFSYTIKNNIYGALATRNLNIRFIPNITGLGTIFLNGFLKKSMASLLYKIAFKKLDHVFFQNSEDAYMFKEERLIDPKIIRILPGSGIDLDRYRGTGKQPRNMKFLMISRLIREKGVIEFVQAAKNLGGTTNAITFQLLGATDSNNPSGISEDTLAEWVEEGIIEYLGVREDVRPFIESASCIVLPSYREGAPRVLIEAAAMSRPAITTNVPGCSSVVDNLVTGLLVNVEDVNSLERAMLQFIDMPKKEREVMGVMARKKAEKEFDEKIVFEAYRKAIKEE